MSTTLYSKLLPPTWLLVAVVLGLGLHFIFPIVQIITIPWRFLGLIPLVLGIAISSIAEGTFSQIGTTIHPYKEPKKMVTTGLFHYSRNPMYLGFVLILFGVAILLGSLTPFGIIPFFIWLLTARFIRVEEKYMDAQFGQDWLEYKSKVRRWI
jgi:protein-S-isoprenylcysteine O-methyltransferase Ste14